MNTKKRDRRKTMEKRTSCLPLCMALGLSLCLVLSGCGGHSGNEAGTPGESAGTAASEAGSLAGAGVSPGESAASAEMTLAEGASDEGGKADSSGQDSPMEPVLQAIIRAIAEDGYRYNSGDQHFIWRALYYAALEESQSEAPMTQGRDEKAPPAEIRVEEQKLLLYLHAFFEDVETLPDIDESTEAYVSREGSQIIFQTDGEISSRLQIGEPEDLGDGSLRIKGDYLDASGEKKSGWIFFVRPRGEGFPYVVQYLENESFMCSDIYEAMQNMTAGESSSAE